MRKMLAILVLLLGCGSVAAPTVKELLIQPATGLTCGFARAPLSGYLTNNQGYATERLTWLAQGRQQASLRTGETLARFCGSIGIAYANAELQDGKRAFAKFVIVLDPPDEVRFGSTRQFYIIELERPR